MYSVYIRPFTTHYTRLSSTPQSSQSVTLFFQSVSLLTILFVYQSHYYQSQSLCHPLLLPVSLPLTPLCLSVSLILSPSSSLSQTPSNSSSISLTTSLSLSVTLFFFQQVSL
uniref:Uncharacterized protein n=1 Tax=Cacopsylla melanoneura TaxID=428564 RepID=A0A8D9EIF4_9HEMI